MNWNAVQLIDDAASLKLDSLFISGPWPAHGQSPGFPGFPRGPRQPRGSPHLEILAPYAACTSLRDSMIWESEAGAKVQWTAMGEGNVDLKSYFQRFAQLCPKVPVHIETISGFAVEFPYLKPEFWDVWPKARARDFAAFVALAKSGRPIAPHRSPNAQEEQAYQRGELERSLDYCKNVLGLGLLK